MKMRFNTLRMPIELQKIKFPSNADGEIASFQFYINIVALDVNLPTFILFMKQLST